jgi:hypothetical protein
MEGGFFVVQLNRMAGAILRDAGSIAGQVLNAA